MSALDTTSGCRSTALKDVTTSRRSSAFSRARISFLKSKYSNTSTSGGEPVDVVGEVVRQPVGVGQQVGEGVVRGVVERPAGGLLDLDLEPVRVVVLRRQLAHRLPVGLEDAVEASQDREREDHVAVLVGAVGAPKLVGDRPDETTEGAHKAPYEDHSTTDAGRPARARACRPNRWRRTVCSSRCVTRTSSRITTPRVPRGRQQRPA